MVRKANSDSDSISVSLSRHFAGVVLIMKAAWALTLGGSIPPKLSHMDVQSELNAGCCCSGCASTTFTSVSKRG